MNRFPTPRGVFLPGVSVFLPLEPFSYLALKIKKSDTFLAPDLDFVSFVYTFYHTRPDSNPGKNNKKVLIFSYQD